ncbi:hypothetical protein XENOCAPTIV_004889 [Xenoophorus captivus]|uniref:Uncharacterized protein n=1 Tax=Xenoophorus captivus TaxID=1517983 RepID=A0ABV0RWX2_9TELE
MTVVLGHAAVTASTGLRVKGTSTEAVPVLAPEALGTIMVKPPALAHTAQCPVQALSNQIDVESVVKTLAPVFLAELDKMKSSPGSSSPYDAGEELNTKRTAGSSAKLKV